VLVLVLVLVLVQGASRAGRRGLKFPRPLPI
jgi:hypothetical protein